jgi:NAD+ synthase
VPTNWSKLPCTGRLHEIKMKQIKLAQMDVEQVANEIAYFILDRTKTVKGTGAVLGISGGVDSTTVAALANRAYQNTNFELVGYMLPTKVNTIADTEDGINVAERLGIRYEVQEIEPIVEAFKYTNPEAFETAFHKGNLMSRIRGNVLNTKSATEKKILLGTGNRDEDFGIGYYTLFGDGAVHCSPIGDLPKRLVREMARYLGFSDLADRVPTAGLEPGQTDFGDLGYSYDLVELVGEGLRQGFNKHELKKHPKVLKQAEKEICEYADTFGTLKFNEGIDAIVDILHRHENIAIPKAELICPKIAKITLRYE